ncbi:MAG: thioredoxin domain-containing protein [Marinirhabdus sp.]|nr:thioredoxin domain-containing protein [Marinirhabdus sp.]
MESHRYTNALVHETSPYLLQHAHNPVNWNPWNTKVLQRAKEEKKLLLISIGYAACHWCHVMEKESFEDSTVAAVMNENFINIKVDREERPDVDQVYINAVQLMTGSAGWPLNVIALPDGRPVWGGTYFQKDAWVDRITQIESLYRTEPEKLEAYASNLQKGIASMDLVTRNDENGAIQTFPLDETMATLKKTFDPEYGGTNRAPKFMMPNALSFLLRLGVQSNDQELIDHVFLTLDKMAYGGLYDAVGGGFSRYSVDNRWHVPHFEKMLYDNALLVSLYSEAYAFSKNPLYKDVVEETLAFIATEMTNDEGGFYSSLDADSDNDKGELEEGAFYTYTEDELRGVLGDDFTLFQAFYNVNDFGYWQEEDAYVLIRKESDASFAENSGLSEADFQKKKKKWRKALQTFREKRARPRLDDKTLTSWNALMLNGYIDAYKTFPNDAYLEVALRNAAFLKKNMLKSDGSLYHSYKNGTSTINGYLEDYASLSKAYIALYEVTLDETWLNLSKELVNFAIAHFQDGDSNMFYFTSDEDAELVTRTIEYRDNVIPASNSIMANNLYKLSHYFEAPEFRELSDQMLKNVLPDAEKYPSSFSNWLSLLLNHRFRHYEVVVSGSDAKDKMRDLQSKYIPNAIFAGAENKSNSYLLEGRFIENQTLIYVCVNNACRLPVSNVEDALANIKITE